MAEVRTLGAWALTPVQCNPQRQIPDTPGHLTTWSGSARPDCTKKEHPIYYYWLAFVAYHQCITDHAQNVPGMLQASVHFPHGWVGSPPIQYISVDHSDGEPG